MLESLLGAIRSLLDWLDALPPGRQAIVTTLVASGALSVLGAVWFGISWLVRRLRSWHARRAAEKVQLSKPTAPQTLALAQRLQDEEEAAGILVQAIPRILSTMTAAIARQQAIGRSMAAVAHEKHKARSKFNKVLSDHAAQFRRTASTLLVEIKNLEGAADRLERVLDTNRRWYELTGQLSLKHSPVDAIRTFKTFIGQVDRIVETYSKTPDQVQGLRVWRDDLTAAVDSYIDVCNRLIGVFRRLGDNAADQVILIRRATGWRGALRRTWIRLFRRSGLHRALKQQPRDV